MNARNNTHAIESAIKLLTEIDGVLADRYPEIDTHDIRTEIHDVKEGLCYLQSLDRKGSIYSKKYSQEVKRKCLDIIKWFILLSRLFDIDFDSETDNDNDTDH